MMIFDVVAVSRQMQCVKNGPGDVAVSYRCDSQLPPLPMMSPARDDLFIDDTSDVDTSDRYMFSL